MVSSEARIDGTKRAALGQGALGRDVAAMRTWGTIPGTGRQGVGAHTERRVELPATASRHALTVGKLDPALATGGGMVTWGPFSWRHNEPGWRGHPSLTSKGIDREQMAEQYLRSFMRLMMM